MERAIRYIVLFALFGVMPAYFGCAQKSARLQQSVAPPDRTLFEMGENYLSRGLYTRSRLAFQNLLNTYPDSDIALDAYFAIGDSFYEEGGTENLLQAENQYKDFIIFAPQGDPRAAEAQLKIISLNHKMMNTPDRDTQYAEKTLREIEVFEKRYPNSVYLSLVRQYKTLVEDNLARGHLGVGDFYLKRGSLLAAIRRYETVVEDYKNFEDMDTVMFRISDIYSRVSAQAPDPEAAAAAAAVSAGWLARIVEGYPFSRYFEDAKKRLTAMGFEIPEVNQALAAANQANIRPSEGFSPLKPLVDFGKALGFIGPPDLYENAQKAIAEEKSQAASKAGAGTGDDIQIETEIRKSASGAPVGETTAPPANSGNTDALPDSSPYSAPDADDGANPSGDTEQQRKPGRYQRKP